MADVLCLQEQDLPRTPLESSRVPSRKPLNVGVVGCGMVSETYLSEAARFDDIAIVALSDRDMDRARARAGEFGIAEACPVDELMCREGVDIILNLTTPQSHAPVALRAIEAGKHVYNEKPLAATVPDARSVLAAAHEHNLRVGCAPDTFLGGAIQTAMTAIDEGQIGTPISASGAVLLGGPEWWHPEPESFLQQGGGPMFDIGVYYLTALVACIGPIGRVAGTTRVTNPERTIFRGPRAGTAFAVSTPTHVAGTFAFRSGAVGTLTMSFDVTGRHGFELGIQGTEGSLRVPDVCHYGETWRGPTPVSIWRRGEKGWGDLAFSHGYRAPSHGIGMADMAKAIRTGRPHRASGELAFHVLEVMQAFIDSSAQRTHIDISSTCERPRAMPPKLRPGELD